MAKRILIAYIEPSGERWNSSAIYPDTATLQEILADFPQLPQSEIDRLTDEEAATVDFQLLPDWVKTISADAAAQHVHDNVLNGFDQAALDNFIDTRFAGVTTFAAAAPLILQTFKDIGGQLIMFRDLMELVVKLLMYIRDLILKYRQAQ